MRLRRKGPGNGYDVSEEGMYAFSVFGDETRRRSFVVGL